MNDNSFNFRIPKRWARITMIVGVTALIVAPLTAIASHSFTDVPDSNTFHDEIAWLAEAEVTKGCNPSEGNTRFCPDDNVTRGQMAAFMERFASYLGAKDGTPAEADHATTADNATTADSATTAETADSVVDGAITAPKLGTIIDRSDSEVIADGSGGSVGVECEADEVMISGGTQTAGVGAGAQNWSLIWSGPSDNGWSAAARNDKGSPGTLIVHVLCLQP